MRVGDETRARVTTLINSHSCLSEVYCNSTKCRENSSRRISLLKLFFVFELTTRLQDCRKIIGFKIQGS
jgi:hypothetical protein